MVGTDLRWHDLRLLGECDGDGRGGCEAGKCVEPAAHIELHIRILLLTTNTSRCRNFTTAHSRCVRSKTWYIALGLPIASH